MFTMGAAIELVADWAGDPGAVLEYGVRFTRPVPVPNPGEARIEVTGVIGALDPDAGTVRIDLAVEFEGAKVLGKAQAVVRLR
jgi:acyl dehydratase